MDESKVRPKLTIGAEIAAIVGIPVAIALCYWQITSSSAASAKGGADVAGDAVTATPVGRISDQPDHPAPSFDCSRVQSKVLTMVCGDPELIMLDLKLEKVYSARVSAASGPDARGALISSEERWMKRRMNCEDHACIEKAYEQRIAELDPQHN